MVQYCIVEDYIRKSSMWWFAFVFKFCCCAYFCGGKRFLLIIMFIFGYKAQTITVVAVLLLRAFNIYLDFEEV